MTLRRFVERLIWLCMLPLLLATVFVSLHHLRSLTHQRDQLAESVVRSAAHAVENLLQPRIKGLELLAELAVAGPVMDQAGLEAASKRYAHTYGAQVILVSAEGFMVFNTRVPELKPRTPLPPIRGKSAFKLALASGQPSIGDMFQSPFTGADMFAIAVPVQRPNAPIQVLLAVVELGEIRQRIADYRIPASWSLAVIDSGQNALAQRGEHEDWTAADKTSSTWSALTAQGAWTVRLHADGWSHFWLLRGQLITLALTCLSAVGLAYMGGRMASGRLTRSMASLTDRVPDPSPDQDIDEVAQVRQRLQVLAREREWAEARLRAVFRSAGDAIIGFNEEGRIVLANEAAAQWRGAAVDQLNGTLLRDWVPTRHRARFDSMLAELRAGPDNVTWRSDERPLRMRRALGGEMPVEVALTRVTVHGEHLFVMVIHDISRREETQRQLRRLLLEQQRVEEAERRRIGLELHDELQQRLAVLRNDLVSLTSRLQGVSDRNATPDAMPIFRCDGLNEEIESARRAAATTDAVIQATRRLVQDLRPQVLDDLGLQAALEAMVGRLHRPGELSVDLQVREGDAATQEPPTAVAVALYRITQEALNNVIKHAQARSAHVFLDLSQPDAVEVEVVDDGSGFDVPAARSSRGLGLLGMQERAQALGGDVVVRSATDGGTVITARIPRLDTALTEEGDMHGGCTETAELFPPEEDQSP